MQFTATAGKEKWTAYKFTRNVYDKFLPVHVKRVKSAVIQLPDPKDFLVKSLTSIASVENDPGLPNSQEMAPPSQDMGSQKRQRLPPKAMLQQENDRQRQEIDQLRRERHNQTEQFMQQLTHRDEQLELQRREMKQENDELKNRINQLIAQIDLLLKQQALPMLQTEKGSNASKPQSSETSGLSQVFEDQSLSQQSNPNATSAAGNDDRQSSLADIITPDASLSYEMELGASKQPNKRRHGVRRK